MHIKDKQPSVYRLFSTLIQKNKLQHAYLLEGKMGSGRLEVAKWLAKVKLCPNPTPEHLPCETCSVCRRIEREEHPDVVILRPEGQSIKVDQVRAVRQEFSRSGMETSQKVLIVEYIEQMTVSGANSLLKFLEEPEAGVMILLLTENAEQLLPTIVSRAQLVHFKDQPYRETVERFMEQGLAAPAAHLLAKITQDSQEAQALAAEEQFDELTGHAWRWVTLLLNEEPQAFLYVQTVLKDLLNERSLVELFLDVCLLAYQDILDAKYLTNDELAFISRQKEIKNYSSRLDSKRLTKHMEVLFEAFHMLEANVSTSAILEKIAIQVLKNDRIEAVD